MQFFCFALTLFAYNLGYFKSLNCKLNGNLIIDDYFLFFIYLFSLSAYNIAGGAVIDVRVVAMSMYTDRCH